MQSCFSLENLISIQSSEMESDPFFFLIEVELMYDIVYVTGS